MEFKTLHIFSYGETQVITDEVNKKTATENVADVPALVASIYALKPADSPATSDYRVITVFKDMFADFSDESGNHFRVDYDQLNLSLIDSVATVVLAS